MTSPATDQVSVAEIAALLTWARSLSDAGHRVDPAQQTAHLAAKTTLLARLADTRDTQ